MSYCLNPDCLRPQNPDDAKFCQTCGSKLLLGDRYRALHLMAQGGFGRTFLALDTSRPGDPLFCVIKQFLPTFLSPQHHQKAADLFRQEAEQLRQLGEHPQIPQLFDHYEQADGQYLVQEFVEGPNLEQQLAQKGIWSETQVRSLLNQLLPVLRFIHRAQVIHRDIKPENIILPVRGELPVLVDFGASKLVTQTALSRTGTVIGSAGYAAPEQAIGKAEFGSDLYSLGVTCIHLLTGIHPFDLYSVSEDRWIWQQYLTTPISTRLSYVLNKMIRRATRLRYQTVDQVLSDLNAAAKSRKKAVGRSRHRRLAAAETLRQLPSQPPEETATRSRSVVRPPAVRSPVEQILWHCCYTISTQTTGITCLDISPDGKLLAAGSTDCTIRLWLLETGELYQTLPGKTLWFGSGHRDQISSVRFSPDDYTLFSSSYDGTVKQWDLLERRVIATFPSHGWVVSALALSEDGRFVTSGGSDGSIKVWDLDTGALIQVLNGHRDRISGLAIRADGAMLVSSSHDQTLCLWDVPYGTPIETLKAHADQVTGLAVSPDWQVLVSGSSDCTVKIWHLPTGRLWHTFAKHRDRITALTISPNGKLLASGSEDSTIQLWHLRSGEQLATLQHDWGIYALAFAPDNQTLISSSQDETLRIWQRRPI